MADMTDEDRETAAKALLRVVEGATTGDVLSAARPIAAYRERIEARVRKECAEMVRAATKASRCEESASGMDEPELLELADDMEAGK